MKASPATDNRLELRSKSDSFMRTEVVEEVVVTDTEVVVSDGVEEVVSETVEVDPNNDDVVTIDEDVTEVVV
ncbi:hypothetical protein ACFLRF_04350 [Candidatus Altiarchaeota archaeon]